MRQPVYRTLTLLCELVYELPIGTNLGVLYVFVALLSGELLTSRGALIPALSALGLALPVVRRAWTAFAEGRWQIQTLLNTWHTILQREGHWQAHQHAGYRPLVIDTVGFFRPRLKHCATKHYDHRAGKALPAIPLAIIASIGSVAHQRLAVPRAFVRPRSDAPSEAALQTEALQTAVALAQPNDILIVDGGFSLAAVQTSGVKAYLVRGQLNLTARRATPPPYKGHGRKPTHGEIVRPLARQYTGHTLAATPPDRVETWSENNLTFRAEFWDDLVLRDAPPPAARFMIAVLYDPRYATPLLLVTNVPLCGAVLRALYLDRWPIEHLPLVAKQLIGAMRQWVSAPEARYRLPELALLAGHLLSYLAATHPPVATGKWDRHPQRTAGRLRRVLRGADFFNGFTFPERVREKRSVTAQLPKGFAAHLRAYAKKFAATLQ